MALQIKRARKSVALVTDLGLAAEHERAVAALQRAQRAAKQDARENDPGVKDAAAVVVAIEQKMRADTVHVDLEALPRKKWAEFEESHPPRAGNETDEAFKIDVSSLDEAIGDSVVGAVDADGEPVEFAWVDVAEDISNAQWQDFALAVLQLNRGTTDAPFSLAASAVTRNSGEN